VSAQERSTHILRYDIVLSTNNKKRFCTEIFTFIYLHESYIHGISTHLSVDTVIIIT